MRRYREAYLRLGSSVRVRHDSSRRENAGCGQVLRSERRGQNGVPSSIITKPGLPAKSFYSHLSQVDRNVLYELLKLEHAQSSRDVPADSVDAPRCEHVESRGGNSALEFSTQRTRDSGSSQGSTSIGDCGGYAVDHESLPIIVAVHSAGAHGKASEFVSVLRHLLLLFQLSLFLLYY